MRYKYISNAVSLFVICVALAGCDAPVLAAKTACTADAQQFWKRFRIAVLENNPSGVADLTQFPFIVSSGIVDTDRKNTSIQRTEFIKRYPQLLSQDPGLKIEPSTMLDLIKTSEQLKESFCASDGEQFRAGDWVFQVKSQNWRFVQVYVGDE
jgi:hypothetical protein